MAIDQNSLFSEELNLMSDINVESDSFFLQIGNSYQLSAILNDGSGIDLSNSSTGTEYFLNVDSSIATITVDGLININGSNLNLINSREPLNVFVKNDDKIGIGQFAIYGSDSDNDLITDFAELKMGTNPNQVNQLDSDLDMDGLIDFEELYLKTNPNSTDTDLDGHSDFDEVFLSSDPLNPFIIPYGDLPVKTTEINRDQEISIYPNPTTNHLNVSLKSPETIETLTIISIEGKVVLEKQFSDFSNNHRIDISNLTNGIYLISIRYSNKIAKKLFIKN